MLEKVLHALEELRRRRAVHDAVVEGQRQHHRGTHLHAVGHGHRRPVQPADAEDRGLRRVEIGVKASMSNIPRLVTVNVLSRTSSGRNLIN